MSGIWLQYLHDHAVDADAWRRALDGRQLVGTCRECGGRLAPQEPYEVHGGAQWFPARCIECGREVAAPGSRPGKDPPGYEHQKSQTQRSEKHKERRTDNGAI